MKMLCDDINQVYVWVDTNEKPVSPFFDYEDDAIMWKEMKEAGKDRENE